MDDYVGQRAVSGIDHGQTSAAFSRVLVWFGNSVSRQQDRMQNFWTLLPRLNADERSKATGR